MVNITMAKMPTMATNAQRALMVLCFIFYLFNTAK